MGGLHRWLGSAHRQSGSQLDDGHDDYQYHLVVAMETQPEMERRTLLMQS